jgi:predicted SAM-dependent methyltransferase
MSKQLKLALGCGKRNYGKDWIHVDKHPYDHLGAITDVGNLFMFKDNSADIIYASHVIAYFDEDEIKDVLKEWHRVLKPEGILRLATPNIEMITKLYHLDTITLKQMEGMIYGRMQMNGETIHHKTLYDYISLCDLLVSNGFDEPQKYNWRLKEHRDVDDHSQAYLPHMDKDHGVLVSLNVECKKEKL